MPSGKGYGVTLYYRDSLGSVHSCAGDRTSLRRLAQTTLRISSAEVLRPILLTHAFLRHFLGYPSQPMSTVGTVFPLVRTFAAYLYSGSLTTELALGLQFDRAQLCL